MRVLDLFSGIGMYALGAEQAGAEIVGFCEREVWARKVIKKHWPMKPTSSCVKSLIRGLMPSLRAGRARMLPLPTAPAVKELKVNAQDFGQDYLEPFAWYDQKSRSWRTWQHCLIEGWAKYSGTWPQSGMTRNGIAYKLKPLVCPMKEKDFISLRTPCASDCKGTSRKRFRGSPHFVGGRLTEFLRSCQDDPTYTHPNFAEAMMGLDKDYTALATEIRRPSSSRL